MILALLSKQSLWFASRGTGVVSILLLTASVVLGVITSVRFETRRIPRFVTLGLHRNISLLVIVFVTAHIATSIVDGFIHIGALDAFVPFRSPYRAVWLGLGTVAADLLIALTLTSVLRVRIGLSIWRAVHWLAYVSWPIALMHGLGAGSDTTAQWMRVLDGFAVLMVVAVVIWRVQSIPSDLTSLRLGAAAMVIVVPATIAIWAANGPLQSTWAKSFRKPVATTTTSGVPSIVRGHP